MRRILVDFDASEILTSRKLWDPLKEFMESKLKIALVMLPLEYRDAPFDTIEEFINLAGFDGILSGNPHFIEEKKGGIQRYQWILRRGKSVYYLEGSGESGDLIISEYTPHGKKGILLLKESGEIELLEEEK